MKQQSLGCRQSDRCRMPHQNRILLSGFSDHEKTSLADKIIQLGGKYLDSKIFVADCTHVVSVRPLRSEKYLCGCAAGKYVVTPGFIHESAAAGRWLDVDPYIWGSPRSLASTDEPLAMSSAPKRWSRHLELTNQGAFVGWTIAIMVTDTKKRRAVYKRLIECGGGEFITLRFPIREPEVLAKLLTYIFVDKCYEEKVRPLRAFGVPCLVPDFIAEYLFEDSPDLERYDVSTYVPKSGDDSSREDSVPNVLQSGTSTPSHGSTAKLTSSTAHSTKTKSTEQIIRPRGRQKRTSKTTQTTQISNDQSPLLKSLRSLAIVADRQSRLAQLPAADSSDLGDCSSASVDSDQGTRTAVEYSTSEVGQTVADVVKTHSARQYSRVPYWMQVQPPKHQEPRIQVAFSRTVCNMIEACLEEGFWLRAVDTLRYYLSVKSYPTPALLHVMMSKILETTDPAFTTHTIHLLKSVICLHRPSTPEMSQVYLQSFVPPRDTGLYGLAPDDPIDTPWDFIGNVIRKSLQMPLIARGVIEVKDGLRRGADGAASSLDRGSTPVTNNNHVLLDYIVCLLEQDFQEFLDRSESYDPAGRPAPTVTHHSMISTILWPTHYINASAANVRQLLNYMLQAVHSVKDNPEQYPCLRVLVFMVEMAAECCRMPSVRDRHFMGWTQTGLHQDLAVEIASLAKQHGTADQSEELNILLSMLRPDWLKLRVTESLLGSYDDSLLPEELRCMASEPISLRKVVRYYFYLLPPMTATTSANKNPPPKLPQKSPRTDSRKRTKGEDFASEVIPLKTLATSNNGLPLNGRLASHSRSTRRKDKVNRRNTKGETPLHVACIKNDLAKLRDLLISPIIQVNQTDYAGWTALHEATNHGHVDCVRELLKYKPRPTITSYFAVDKGKNLPSHLELLAAPTECGTTPLHDAVYNGHVDVARLLVQAGGNSVLVARNKKGFTPVDMAGNDVMRDALRLGSKENLEKENMVADSVRQKCAPSRPSEHHPDANRHGTSQPTDATYARVLGTARNPKMFVTAERCENFCVLICNLLHGFLSSSKLAAVKTGLALGEDTVRSLLARYQLPGDYGSTSEGWLFDDLTELGRLESHFDCFVAHLGRIGPWVGSERSKMCQVVLYGMKVLIKSCL